MQRKVRMSKISPSVRSRPDTPVIVMRSALFVVSVVSQHARRILAAKMCQIDFGSLASQG